MRRTLKALALGLLCAGWSAAAQTKINPATQVNWPAGCQYYNVATKSCPPLSQITFKGTWNSASTYAANDAVYYNGTQYIGLLNANLNHQPDISPTYWGVLVAGSTVQVNGVALLSSTAPQNYQNSSTVTFANTSAGNITASVSTTTLAQQVTAPLSGGQSVVLYPTAFTPTTGDAGTGSLTGAKTSAVIGNGPGGGPLTSNTWGITWNGFALPSDIPAANVTSVYAFMVSSVTGINSVTYGGCTGTGGGAGLTPGGNLTTGINWTQKQFTQLTGITGANLGTISCNARTERSSSTTFTEQYSIPSIGLIVYYTGTPSTYGSTAAQVASPLYFNPALNTLGIDPQASFHGLDLIGITIASLPAQPLTPSLGMLINNGSTTTDCTTGGGSNYVLCRWNGTNWASFIASGSTTLTGDVTGSGTGSLATTLATVNSSPGTCGDSTHVCQFTDNGKGLVTSQTAVAISGISSVATVASSETVTFSATPTFSNATNVSEITMTASITSFTMAAGSDGQLKILTFCQDATGGRTVSGVPANVRGFFTPGATASLCSTQTYHYSASHTAWLANDLGRINE